MNEANCKEAFLGPYRVEILLEYGLIFNRWGKNRGESFPIEQ